MKAFILSALLFRAVHAQQGNDPPADTGATTQNANLNADNGSSLPPDASFSDPGVTLTPSILPDVLATLPPGTNDVVLPSANVDGLATAVLNAVSSALGGTRFGPSVEPVSRPLLGAASSLAPTASGRGLPGQPAPVLAPAPLKAPASVPSSTGKARTGGFAGLSVDEGDPLPPADGSTDPDGTADTPTDTPTDAPVEDVPTDQPTEDQPAEDAPTDQPADDQPVDDTPTDQPADDTPTDTPADQPLDEQPVTDDPDATPADDSDATPADDPDAAPADDPDATPADDPDATPADDSDSSPEEPANTTTDDPTADSGSNPADDPQPAPEDDSGDDQQSNPDDGGDSSEDPSYSDPTDGEYPSTPSDDEPWTGGSPGTGYGKSPSPLPIGPPGYENEDNGYYDGEDYENPPTIGKGTSPSGTQGNGHPDSGYGTDEPCPEWCLEDDTFPVDTSSSAAPEETQTVYKRKHKRKKTSKTPHRIAISVDNNVIYDSNYAREVAADIPSSGGFESFSWPTKHADSGSVKTTLPSSGSDSNGPPAYGRPYPFEETTDHPYDSEFDQNTDYDDHDHDKLPQWLIDLQNGKTKTAKGKKGKKKAKGKCPKSCIRPSSSWTISPTASSTSDPLIFLKPTTFITITTTDDSSSSPSSIDDFPSSPSSTGSSGSSGLPAGSVSSGDTWTGDTLAGLCPKTCNPFNPAENFCGITTGCTTTGGRNYYCACRAGYKVGKAADKDFSQQFKVPGQPYVYTWPGAECDTLCEDQLCNEVMERAQCL